MPLSSEPPGDGQSSQRAGAGADPHAPGEGAIGPTAGRHEGDGRAPRAPYVSHNAPGQTLYALTLSVLLNFGLLFFSVYRSPLKIINMTLNCVVHNKCFVGKKECFFSSLQPLKFT